MMMRSKHQIKDNINYIIAELKYEGERKGKYVILFKRFNHS